MNMYLRYCIRFCVKNISAVKNALKVYSVLCPNVAGKKIKSRFSNRKPSKNVSRNKSYLTAIFDIKRHFRKHPY